MVAQTVELPNLRKMFPPDPGFTIAEFDLAQADAQVVAWEAEDEHLKQIFRERLDLHTENAKTIFGKTHITKTERQKAKVGAHAINYGCKARTLAIELAITVVEAEYFIKTWFGAHPGIPEWHKRTENDLRKTNTVENKFGFRRYYMNRIGGLLPKALAWIPQSTVAIVTYKGMLRFKREFPEVQQLLQVHDSVVVQIPTELCPNIYEPLRQCMEVPIPYDDPLIIPVGIKVSKKSWGDIVDPFA